MTFDRSELAGTGAALLLHVALIAALSTSLAHVARTPEPPAMEVELVEEVGLQAAAPAAAPAPAQAPEISDAPLEQPPAPLVVTTTPPAPRIVPTPAPRAIERAAARPARQQPQFQLNFPSRPTRAARIGDDFLKGVAGPDSLAPKPAAAAALTFSASALAGIQQSIRRQIQPCADRQVDPGGGANRIRVTLNLRLSRSGRLAGQPRIIRTSGVDEENARFEDRVKDLAVAAYVGCSPLSGLPPELYQTAQGGWSNINMTYRLP